MILFLAAISFPFLLLIYYCPIIRVLKNSKHVPTSAHWHCFFHYLHDFIFSFKFFYISFLAQRERKREIKEYICHSSTQGRWWELWTWEVGMEERTSVGTLCDRR